MRKILVALMLVVLAAPAWGSDAVNQNGMSEEDANDYARYKKGEDEYKKKQAAQKVYSQKCKNGFGGVNDLLNMNPFDNKDYCFSGIPMRSFSLLSKNTALYRIVGTHEPIALITFKKRSAPVMLMDVVFRGLGAFQYESVSGGIITVHKFEVISL